MPMQCIDWQEQHVVRQDLPAAEGIGSSDIARQHADRRVKPHGLFDHLLHVGRRFHMIGVGSRISQGGTSFCLSPLLRLWMQSQKQQRPGQRQRRCFVAGHDEELHVVQKVRR
jgi:hypothetical protein